jgi:hypothetical protein
MMDGVRPRGIIRMMVPFGSISFAALSANGRYLRIPAGWSRREADVADFRPRNESPQPRKDGTAEAKDLSRGIIEDGD